MKPSRAGLEKLFSSHTQALLNASSITLHTRSLAERGKAGKEDTMILSRDHDLYWSFLFPWSLQTEKVLSCQGQTFDVGIGSWQHPAVFCSWIFVSWRQFMIWLSKEMLIRMVFQVKCQHSQIIFLQLDLFGFSATGRQTFWDWSPGNFRSFRGTYVLRGWECWICSTSLRSCGGSSGPSSPGFRSRHGHGGHVTTCGCAASPRKFRWKRCCSAALQKVHIKIVRLCGFWCLCKKVSKLQFSSVWATWDFSLH